MLITDLPVAPAPVDWRRWHLDVQMGWKTSEEIDADAKIGLMSLALLHRYAPGKDPATAFKQLYAAPDALPPLPGTIQSRLAGISLARRYLGLAKIPGLVEHLTDEWTDDKNRKVVLFFETRDVGMGLREALVEYKPVLLFKGTPAAHTAKRHKDFSTRWQNKVAIIQIQAAGGVPMLTAREMLFVELSATPSENYVAAMTLTGNTPMRPVTLAGTVDGALMRARWAETVKLLEGVTA